MVSLAVRGGAPVRVGVRGVDGSLVRGAGLDNVTVGSLSSPTPTGRVPLFFSDPPHPASSRSAVTTPAKVIAGLRTKTTPREAGTRFWTRPFIRYSGRPAPRARHHRAAPT